MKTVAVLGLGIIGKIWASHYERAGLLAATWNRSAQPDSPRWSAELKKLPVVADHLHIVIADPAAVESVLSQLQPHLGPRHVVIQSSTIDPESSGQFSRLVTATGARYVEAPFTGSKPAAEQQKTTFYLGGNTADIEEITPTISHLSQTRLHICTCAQAAALKLTMNMQLATMVTTLTEALTLARRAGISDEIFFGAMEKNPSWSGVAALKAPKLRAADFAPQFSVKHMHKDVRLAARMAGCVELPVLDAVRERLKTAEARGLAEEDFSALIKLIE